MNKDILLGQYEAIAEMLQSGIISDYDSLKVSILKVHNNELPF